MKDPPIVGIGGPARSGCSIAFVLHFGDELVSHLFGFGDLVLQLPDFRVRSV